ncbi:MAG: hypothetical protein V2I65_05635 [Paracoccaceae bacterium]|jgi:hypothetical protein|nr:hypothetical protein [Paracoccaceae bacterium]
MTKHWLMLAAVLAVAACDGSSPNPVNGPGRESDEGGEGGTEAGVVVPEGIAGNVGSIEWVRGEAGDADDRLIISGVPLDDSPVAGVYERAPSADQDGYLAFSKQDDRLDRIFVALAGETPDGAVRGIVVGDGGQFGIEYGGIDYARTGEFTPPDPGTTNGLVSYAGRYAGVTDLADLDQDLRLNPGGSDGTQPVPADAVPDQPRTVRGKVFMNVDFADNTLNGVIYDRTYSDGAPLGDEQFLRLTPGNIDEAGNFAGTVQQQVAAEEAPRVYGAYAGTFGGENASGMVGALQSQEGVIRRQTADGEFENIELSSERGIWVIPRCSGANADPVCGEVNDIDGLIPAR